MSTFLKLKCTLVMFLFVCFFIHFVDEIVWNVLVNQKGILYIYICCVRIHLCMCIMYINVLAFKKNSYFYVSPEIS